MTQCDVDEVDYIVALSAIIEPLIICDVLVKISSYDCVVGTWDRYLMNKLVMNCASPLTSQHHF